MSLFPRNAMNLSSYENNEIELISPVGLGDFWYKLRSDRIAKNYMPLLEKNSQELEERLQNASSNFELIGAVPKKFAVKIGQEIVGIAGCNNISETMKYGELDYIIEPSWRGRGIGKSVVNLLSERLFAGGFRKLGAITDARNIASIRLLESNGFFLEGILRKHYVIQGIPRDQLLYSLLRTL